MRRKRPEVHGQAGFDGSAYGHAYMDHHFLAKLTLQPGRNPAWACVKKNTYKVCLVSGSAAGYRRHADVTGNQQMPGQFKIGERCAMHLIRPISQSQSALVGICERQRKSSDTPAAVRLQEARLKFLNFGV